MKKKYITPEMEVAIIETPVLLAGSVTTDVPGLDGFGGIDIDGDLTPKSRELEDLENLLGGGFFGL